MNNRLLLSTALLATTALTIAAAFATFMIAALHVPEPRWGFAARVGDLRQGEPVRAVGPGGVPAYVVRLGDQVIAYHGRAPTVNRCALEWLADKRLFLDDGCVGAQFDVTGRWLAGPASRDLDRHPVVIKDGWVAVDTRTLILGHDLWSQTESQ